MLAGKGYIQISRHSWSIFFPLIFLTLSACGGGGGSTALEDDVPVDVAENDDLGMFEPEDISMPTGDDESSPEDTFMPTGDDGPLPEDTFMPTGGGSVLDDILSPVKDGLDDDDIPPPVNDALQQVDSTPSLENLLGDAVFSANFLDSADVFVFPITFLASGLSTNADGVDQLEAMQFFDSGIESWVCLLTPPTIQPLFEYLCASFFVRTDDPFTLILDSFAFNLDTVSTQLRQGSGNSNFCPIDTLTSDLADEVTTCTIEVLLNPDGESLVEISQNGSLLATTDRISADPLLLSSREGLLHSGSPADMIDYKIVNKQASSNKVDPDQHIEGLEPLTSALLDLLQRSQLER